jgi:hypothetical protein
VWFAVWLVPTTASTSWIRDAAAPLGRSPKSCQRMTNQERIFSGSALRSVQKEGLGFELSPRITHQDPAQQRYGE